MKTAGTRHQATMLISAQTAENIYCVSPLPTQGDYISTVHQVRAIIVIKQNYYWKVELVQITIDLNRVTMN